MRTSNKIILGVFLAPLIIVVAIQAALYAKYKSGDFVSMKSIEEDRFERPALKNINNVVVYGLDNFSITAADSFAVQIEKSKYGHLHYTISGDSLVIHGDSVINHPDGAKDTERSNQNVNLYLPSGKNIIADNSDLRLKGSKDSSKAGAYHFSLLNSASFKIDENDYEDSTYKYFKDLTIKADHASNIEISAYTRIGELNLTMLESQFIDNDAQIGKLTIDVDKKSSVTLKGDNLKKLNLIKQP
jgi:hypothetical protein